MQHSVCGGHKQASNPKNKDVRRIFALAPRVEQRHARDHRHAMPPLFPSSLSFSVSDPLR